MPNPVDSHWWREANVALRINGVFKGGGAKGIMYAGALHELRARGLWFRAVAGSSAGAITASLIASGLSPDEMVSAAPEGLRGIRKMLLGDVVGSPLFRTGRVAKWLEALLRRQVERLTGERPAHDVTFKQLHAATGIELYVIAVDLADRQPRVFSATTTPDIGLTQAVLASSAIPMAFRPGRLRVMGPGGKTSVHRLVDGGVWANYPAFVFRDPSFRQFHRLGTMPDDSITIGFTLDTTRVETSPSALAFIGGMAGAERDRGGFLPWLFRFPLARLYFMTFVPLIAAIQTWYTVEAVGLIFLKDYASRPWMPEPIGLGMAYVDGFFQGFWPGYWSFVIFISLIAVFLAILGGTLLDSGIPAMRTLMSVGTDVPHWVGADRNDHVVRLQVPAWLGTTTFRLKSTQIAEAVSDARRQAGRQVDRILTEVDRARAESDA